MKMEEYFAIVREEVSLVSPTIAGGGGKNPDHNVIIPRHSQIIETDEEKGPFLD